MVVAYWRCWTALPSRPTERINRIAEASPLKIAVIGTGYVGLVTATCLAESGNEVIGIDNDAGKIETLEHW